MRKQIFLLVVAISVLFAMGILMVFNTTSAEVLDRDLDVSTHHALIKRDRSIKRERNFFWQLFQ